jgi:hypothetical protein
MLSVGMERIRVIAETRDLETFLVDTVDNLRGTGLREITYIDVAGARIAPRLAPRGWPGSDLDGGKAIGRGPPDNVVQGSFREGCSEES